MLVPLSITLHSTIGIGWTVLVAVALFAGALWSYRWTRPPMPAWVRGILAVLRGLALLGIWFLLTGFELRWQNEYPRKSRVSVLVDKSASMGLTDQSGNRYKQVEEALSHPVWETIKEKRDIKRFVFDLETTGMKRGNVPDADGPGTDFSQAFQTLAHDPGGAPDAVVLFSDGAVNHGGAPETDAKRLGCPVYVIAIGDSSAPRDVVIAAVDAPERGYAGEEVVLEAMIRGSQLQNQQVQVYLKDAKGNRIAEETIHFTREWDEQVVRFATTPATGGLQSFIVEVESVEREADTGNNSRRTTIKIEDRKRRILFLAGGPSPDASFLIRTLEKDADTDAVLVVGGGPGRKMIRGAIPAVINRSEFDAAVVLPFPGVSPAIRQAVTQVVESGLPLAVITGTNPDMQSIAMLGTRFDGIKGARSMDNIVPMPISRHPLFTLDGTWFEESAVSPPPLRLATLIPKSGRTIAAASSDPERPVVVESETLPRTLIWLAEDLWKWDLGRRSADPGGNGYKMLWDRTLRWLTAEEDMQNVLFEPVKDLFTGGEEIQLRARVRDSALRPLDSLEVSAQVTHGSESRTVILVGQGEGIYRVSLPAWGTGDYSAEATINLSQTESVSRTAPFVVDDFDVETVERRMRPDRLRSLAQATDGSMLTPDRIGELDELLPSKFGTITVKGAWTPFGIWQTLVIIALLLGIEWFIRTRTGMV